MALHAGAGSTGLSSVADAGQVGLRELVCRGRYGCLPIWERAAANNTVLGEPDKVSHQV